MKVLDIGCRDRKVKVSGEVIGLDKIKLPGVDVVWDLEKTPLPFRDNEFDMVYANSVLEHIIKLPELLEELYRITKNGGLIHIEVPYCKSWSACSVYHVRFFNSTVFDFFHDGLSPEANMQFDVVEKKFFGRFPWIAKIANMDANFYEKFLSNFMACEGLRFVLRVRK